MQNVNTPITKEGLATQQAVQDYLDTLLQDATQQALSEPAVVEAPVETTVLNTTDEATAVATVTEVAALAEPKVETQALVNSQVAVVTETEVSTQVETETVTEQASSTTEQVAAQAEMEPQTDVWVDGRPPWAQSTFECLLFNVAGLTLAVPLTELGSVLTFDEELSPLFGQPDWFLGLLPSRTAGTVRVIDTAKKVMPEKYTEAARENLKYVILMKNSDWGLSCHEVAEAITLTPDEVRWRSDRGRRPWLAGTVINHMCAIMDVAALVELVNDDAERIKAPQWSRQTAE